jgi:hypothetical protein
MHDHGNHGSGNEESWSKFRRRREEWRARHEARRQAWKERHARRHAEWEAHWENLGDQLGMNHADWNQAAWGMGAGGASSQTVEELKAQVATMQKTIDKLLDRVAVLEKLAVDGDEVRLAAEIEKLRTRD